jgi:peptide/nickel transport system permease protein
MIPPRLRYVLRRFALAIPTVLFIVVANFVLLHLAPGDAAEVLAGEAGSATPEMVTRLRQKFGLDQPYHVQLGRYLANTLTFDLGYSQRHGMPVVELIGKRLPATLLLMGTTIAIAIGVGVMLGVLAARGLNTWRDRLISVLALLSYATPLFWAGLMLIVLFSIKLDLLPTSGMETVAAFYEGPQRIVDIARHLVLPAVTLSLFYLALYTRLMRAAMLEQSDMDYVVTARAKGLDERRIVFRHILPNALLPVITMAGVQVGALLGGSVIVETVFAWPGLGQLAFDSLFSRDLNLLLGIFFICACLVVVANLLVDLVYTWLDPRIELD